MEKDLLKSVFNKKVQDYTFAILFLIIFSIFIFFAISPSLKTAFSLKKEEIDLKNIDNLYEKKIVNISEIQSQIEETRDKLPLLDQAVSSYPEVNKMVDDVKILADKNQFFIQKANIGDVNLLQTKKEIGNVKLIVEGKTNFENLKNFINQLFEQRRLKTVDSLLITQDKESTQSGLLKVTLVINGFYL